MCVVVKYRGVSVSTVDIYSMSVQYLKHAIFHYVLVWHYSVFVIV